MTQNADNNSIEINLDRSFYDSILNPNSQLQKKAERKLDSLLNSFAESASIEPEKRINKSLLGVNFRSNNTIFIHGERGAGKTTFLKSILQKYSDSNTSKYRPVAFIDPTLIDTDQHIIVDIIAKFHHLMNEQSSCSNNENNFKEYKKALNDMSEGLKLLYTDKDKRPTINDSSWFLNKAIEHSMSGQFLEERFHNLIDTISNYLKTDLFLIVIDDVDTKTDKAYEVLELLRCYMTHPKIVVLISGDLRLYSYIVKNRKAKELHSDKSELNHGNKIELIDHLEQQYLAKILPIDQRIELQNIQSIINDNYSVKITYQEDKKQVLEDNNIQSILKKIISESLNIHEKDINSHLNFILNQPIRNILQLIKNYLSQTNENSSKVFTKSLFNIYIGALVSEGVNYESLIIDNPEVNTIGYELFKLIEKNGDLETGFYARPDSSLSQFGYNAAKLFISSVIANITNINDQSRNLSNFIKLLLTTGASANIYLYQIKNNQIDKNISTQYLNYIGLNRNERIMNISAHFTSFLSTQINTSSNNTEKENNGIIRLPRRVKENSTFLTLLEKYDLEAKRITSLANLQKDIKLNNDEQYINLLNYISIKSILLSSHSIQKNSEHRDYISIYAFIASIAELLEVSEFSQPNPAIELHLNKLSTIQTYSQAAFLVNESASGNLNENEIDSGDDFIIEEDDSSTPIHVKQANELIENWISEIATSKILASSLLVGKVWSRIFHSTNSLQTFIRDETSLKSRLENGERLLLSERFSLYIINVINSILIEEIRFSKHQNNNLKKSLSLARNVSAKDTMLIKNLKTVLLNTKTKKEIIEFIPITYSFLNCPLIWPFLGDHEHKGGLVDTVGKIFNHGEMDSTTKTPSVGSEDDNELNFSSISNHINTSRLSINRLPMYDIIRNHNLDFPENTRPKKQAQNDKQTN